MLVGGLEKASRGSRRLAVVAYTANPLEDHNAMPWPSLYAVMAQHELGMIGSCRNPKPQEKMPYITLFASQTSRSSLMRSSIHLQRILISHRSAQLIP